jgi:hypothetical protein
MKLQTYNIGENYHYDGALEKAEDGMFILASEAEAIINKLKCCGNCKHGRDADEELCAGCCEPKLEKWEMRE